MRKEHNASTCMTFETFEAGRRLRDRGSLTGNDSARTV